MTNWEKFSPRFSISHDFDRAFPGSREKANFGYLPFDMFLTGSFSEGLDDSNFAVYGESLEDFSDNLHSDYLIVFRYKNQEFDFEPGEEIPGGEEEMPGFQREVFPVSITPNQGFEDLLETLERTVDTVTDAEYVYSVGMGRLDGSVRRCTSFGEYLDAISGNQVIAWPEMEGVVELRADPGRMDATLLMYEQDVEVQDSGDDSRGYSFDDEDRQYVHLGYDETVIEQLEEVMEAEGFRVERDYLPDTVSPQDF